MNSSLSVRLLAASLLMLCGTEFAMAQHDVPFDSLSYTNNPTGDPVDPLWLEYCLGEGYQGAFAGSRTGTANHLGKYSAYERGCLDFSDFPVLHSRNIELTFIAANGDQLFALAEADFDFTDPDRTTLPWGVFEFVGGTGRFANATGGGDVVECYAGGVPACLRYIGTISYEASDRRR